MAIILIKNDERTYVGGTGRVTEQDKLRADNIFNELKHAFEEYEKAALKEGIVLPDGKKQDTLKVWYDIGQLLNVILKKYEIAGTMDEPYFWQSAYDHVPQLFQKLEPPQSASGTRNHFKRCAFMASIGDFSYVKEVGNWSTWRDLLDNIRLQEDTRVFKWVVEALHNSGLGHKEVRPFVHDVRRGLKNKDTQVLTDDELFTKLRPSLELIPAEKAKK